ncbi:type IV pilus modification protein PilV [Halomonas alkalicola]|uniref:type IV pilus modification protein PilV n=1 Tax=Halomonas alkalicola TaxID=1930622 RepID=UPI00265DE5EA|nr:type IV pilus modification protein PilV [Halomonas alkalicola]
MPNTKQCSGFTLLEALVALLLIGFGVLGLLAMQMKALQSSHVSYQRTIATMMAMEANELLWANYTSSCPDAESVESRWLGLEDGEPTRWLNNLPITGDVKISEVSGLTCTYLISVAWSDNRFEGEEVSRLDYFARLPFSPD